MLIGNDTNKRAVLGQPVKTRPLFMESQREGSFKVNTQHLAQLIERIGGKENITTVSHCLTRLRFVLADPAKADPKAIETIPSVKGASPRAASSRW